MGNPIMSDDGVGIFTLREVKRRIDRRDDIKFVESSMGGLSLMELMTGFGKAIIIDAIRTKNGRPGDIYILKPEDFPKNARFISVHDISFLDALKFGEKIDLNLPKEITIYAVEAKDVTTFSESCTEEVKPAIEKVAEMVIEKLSPPL